MHKPGNRASDMFCSAAEMTYSATDTMHIATDIIHGAVIMMLDVPWPRSADIACGMDDIKN